MHINADGITLSGKVVDFNSPVDMSMKLIEHFRDSVAKMKLPSEPEELAGYLEKVESLGWLLEAAVNIRKSVDWVSSLETAVLAAITLNLDASEYESNLNKARKDLENYQNTISAKMIRLGFNQSLHINNLGS